MRDSYNREIEYMRVSITDRCNLRCRYCMPKKGVPFIPHEEILRYEEILRICRLAAQAGINNFRVTGGEPLVRAGCMDFIRALKKLPHTRQVTLTTNGVLLAEHLAELADIGIDGINISLDTLDPDIYKDITGGDELKQVMLSLQAALEMGLKIKINCVPIRGINSDGLLEIAQLAEKYPLDVRFIELMPLGSGQGFEPIGSDQIINLLKGRYPDLKRSLLRHGLGPARYYTSRKLQGSIGFIDAISHSFCQNCNRVRLTSVGRLKLCLYYQDSVDLKELLRNGASDDALFAAIQSAIRKKPEKHCFGSSQQTAEQGKMFQIGG